MEWYVVLSGMIGVVMVLFLAGMPVAFAFLLVNIGGIYFFMGGQDGLSMLVTTAFASVASFILLPIPLFILMGEIMFHSGIARRALDALDKWIGRVPGRLSLLAVGSGTVFAGLSGSSMATTAMLASTLVPEMKRKGYSYIMSLGAISAAGGLAVIIPPTALGVLLAALAEISVARLLMAGVVPGLCMAFLYVVYIVGRVKLQPALAPSYELARVGTREKMMALWQFLPLGFIVFMVTGVIFVGVATPTEAAALGVMGTVVVAAMYRQLTAGVIYKSLKATAEVTVVVMLIIVGSKIFSQILAFTGGSRGLVELVTGLAAPPLVVLIMMMLVIAVLGCFIDQISIMMITVPIFFPLASALGFDPIWFGMLMLLNLEVASTTPPFGLQLFVLKGVVPDASMSDIYRSCLPFVLLDFLNLAIMIAFPAVVLTLPGLMFK